MFFHGDAPPTPPQTRRVGATKENICKQLLLAWGEKRIA